VGGRRRKKCPQNRERHRKYSQPAEREERGAAVIQSREGENRQGGRKGGARGNPELKRFRSGGLEDGEGEGRRKRSGEKQNFNVIVKSLRGSRSERESVTIDSKGGGGGAQERKTRGLQLAKG